MLSGLSRRHPRRLVVVEGYVFTSISSLFASMYVCPLAVLIIILMLLLP